MNEFLLTAFSFPTVFFTIVLCVAVVYWLCAAAGLVDLDILDMDTSAIEGQLHAHAEHNFAESFAGILFKLGLNGVPITIVVSLIGLIGWLTSYYMSYLELKILGYGWLHYVLGLPILVAALYCAVLVTAQLIKPLRSLFAKAEQHIEKKILGQVAIVRSSKVTNAAGEASFDDGGAGLILKIRSLGEVEFSRGDRVVLLEFVSEQHFYNVISEDEFLGKKI